MICTALWALLSAPLFAQSAPWIDLSGPWHIVQLPGTNFEFKGRYFWLRRALDLPAGPDGKNLALTLGKISENYQVFANGALVAGAGSFTIEESQIARP